MTNKKDYINKVFYKNAQKMSAVPDACVDLVVTSPPYFNVKDYSKDGYQEVQTNQKKKKQIDQKIY